MQVNDILISLGDVLTNCGESVDALYWRLESAAETLFRRMRN